MNILYMHTHDSGRYWSPYGYQAPTPNILTFAKGATTFRQCYNAAPTCSPSRAALLTGMYPHACGMMGLEHRGFSLYDSSRHMAAYFASQGYKTALSGVEHACLSGYTEILREALTDPNLSAIEDDERSAQAACAYLRAAREKPFFLSVGLVSTHRKYPDSAGVIDDRFVRVPESMPDCAAVRKDFADYLYSASVADACMGRVLDALAETGHDRDTIVLLTTDHGIAFPYQKCNLYDGGMGVACLLRYPGNPLNGTVSDALISQIDLFPTICELAGVKKPDWLQGVSLLPLFSGACASVRDEVFCEVTYHAAYEPMRCVRTNRYKLIEKFDADTTPVYANIDDGASKQFIMRAGVGAWYEQPLQLYDLYNDPNERANLAYMPEYQALLHSIRDKLHNWMRQTDDPLLLGPVPAPAGARINKRASLSPGDRDYV